MSTLTVTPDMSAADLYSFVRKHLEAGEHVQVIATEPFMTPAEAAATLNVSRPYVMARLKSGELRSNRKGNRHRIPVGEVERFRRLLVEDHWAAVASDVEDELFGDQ